MRRLLKVRFGARGLLAIVLAVLMLSASVAAVADEGIIAGFFRGSEMKTTGIGGTCFDDPNATFVYDVITGVTASLSGGYDFSNTGHHYSDGSQIAV